ncbi:iron-containing alcohol dehydrogenase, partial [Klebsiella pneumoniae]|uniref:iron-containing alcohol dehydrogenase n=1 Tax=Klebsiella pneumoniae TaxID=573 RepID=UPI002731667A
RWLVVGDKFVLGFAEEMLRKSLADAGLAAEIAPFGGECSHNEINRLRDIAGNAKCTAVLGIGGGKNPDTAKAVGYYQKLPGGGIPTLAPTQAPTSAPSGVYTAAGGVGEYLVYPKKPGMG